MEKMMIATNKDLLNELKNEIQILRKENKTLKADNDNLRINIDDLEQYSRRNAIRISGIPENSGSENTDDIVKKVVSDMGISINDEDIDRSHRSRRPQKGYNRQCTTTNKCGDIHKNPGPGTDSEVFDSTSCDDLSDPSIELYSQKYLTILHLNVQKEVKEVIRRLEASFIREKQRGGPELSYYDVNGRIAKALKIGKSTVRKVLSSQDQVDNIAEAIHEEQSAKITKTRLDDFDIQLIKGAVHQLFEKREYISKKHTQNMTISIAVHCRIIMTTSDKHTTQKHILFVHFCNRKIKKYRLEDWEIVYVDKTWINSNHACKGEWTHNRSGPTGVIMPRCDHCSRHIPSGKGTRFKQKRIYRWGRSNFYHKNQFPRLSRRDERETFPGLSSLYPTSSTKKDEIVHWLRNRSVDVDDTMLKYYSNISTVVHGRDSVQCWSRTNLTPQFLIALQATLNIITPRISVSELLHLVKLNKPPTKYRTDEIAEENGHLVLRLPVKHCELNPIELIQAEEKMYVASRNRTFKLKDVKRLFLEAKSTITKSSWQKAEEHVIEKVEKYFWE
ncbi:hypothetical protein KUTeg_020913 [Tegillarca granosa]|uniref:Transposase n=1 Tax=Tegillarca granosa TaxID=220873 RepID=A0ABQ9E9A2_TEGGR|nr:hypothetical protein KUTeg_020913 [Tegillarca granosa]